MEHRAIIGREVPLRTLDEALAAPPRVVLVSGEAGIGKTRLVAEVEATAGWLVLHGECVEFGGEELAFAPVVAALRDLPADWLADWLDGLSSEARGALAAVLPRETPGGGGPGRVLELVLDLFTALDRPVLLVLEDIHWADPSTLALLAFLARNLRSQRMVVLATYRVDDELPAAVRRLVGELRRRRAVVAIELAPLTRDDVARQLEAIAGGPVPAALADEVHARAGGNPFFVEELFAADSATTLAEAVLARVARLDQGALSALAAAGGRASFALLEALGVAPDAIRAAVDAGVLVREREGVAFRHGLIGEVVYERLLPSERVSLHRAIAAELDDPAQRAHHCQRAGLRAEALEASIEAGRRAAAVFAYAEAAMHFERALQLGPPTVDLLDRAAQAARHSGDPERAVARCREALALEAEPGRRARLYERLGEYQFWDDSAALACYEEALRLAPGDPRVLAAKGHALMGLRRWEESRACCEAALDAGAAPRITLAVVLTFLGDAEAGEAHARRALELAASGEETARAYLHLGEVLRVRGDHAGALAAMVDGEREAARLGLRGSFGHFMYVNGADDLLRLGRWDEAATRVREAARMDLSRTARPLRRGIAGQLFVARGELEAARAELDAAADDDLPAEFRTPLATARAMLALAEGNPVAAAVHVDGALGGVEDPFYTAPLYALGVRVEAELAERERAHRRAPGFERAHALLAHLEALAGPPDSVAHLALARAEAARVAGSPAPELWERAATLFDALAEPYPAAYARVHGAEATLLAGGAKAAAAEVLGAAREVAESLGAVPLRDAAEALARRARLDMRAAPPAAVDEDHAGLTSREVEVLRLLADGLTNREIGERLFISSKTVGAHMAHIYAKLGVHSRVEAAGRARQLGV
ncbi:helix-turn-helix transcriptional regulator [Solirubrobacter soli]|uniref:helix-turn-helix transcriptional regulator n=1 Tax=Solirubrobacter soli TaxID=363832 RepID=UPI0004124D93|nr:helix-turn-helix transcriptional regulator [Solirubrobacter soli]